MPRCLYHILTIYINSFVDASCWNSKKNNQQMILMPDRNCWFANPESPFFLSYDTGVSHQTMRRNNTNIWRAVLLRQLSWIIHFVMNTITWLYIRWFHWYTEVFCLTLCRSMVSFAFFELTRTRLIPGCLKSSQIWSGAAAPFDHDISKLNYCELIF